MDCHTKPNDRRNYTNADKVSVAAEDNLYLQLKTPYNQLKERTKQNIYDTFHGNYDAPTQRLPHPSTMPEQNYNDNRIDTNMQYNSKSQSWAFKPSYMKIYMKQPYPTTPSTTPKAWKQPTAQFATHEEDQPKVLKGGYPKEHQLTAYYQHLNNNSNLTPSNFGALPANQLTRQPSPSPSPSPLSSSDTQEETGGAAPCPIPPPTSEGEHLQGLDDDGRAIWGPHPTTDYPTPTSILDGGTNVNIVTSQMVDYLSLSRKEYESPVAIRFGQGQIEVATHYVVLGMLDRAAIIDNAPTTLISVAAICDNGLEVRTNSRRIKIVDQFNRDKVLYRKKISSNSLFEVDLPTFLSMTPPKDIAFYQRALQKAGMSKTEYLQQQQQQLGQEIDDNSSDDENDEIAYNHENNTSATPVSFRQTNIKNRKPATNDISNYLSAFYANIDTIVNDPSSEGDDEVIDHAPKQKRRRESSRISRQEIEDVMWLHKCTGHQSRQAIIAAINSNTWTNLPETITSQTVERVLSKLPCTACELAKRNRSAQASGSGIHSLIPGESVSIDYQGKISPASSRGHTGVFLAVDLATGHLFSRNTNSKSAEELIKFLQTIIDFFKLNGSRQVKTFRCDRGSSELSSHVKDFLQAQTPSIHIEPAGIDEQQQNPVERSVQTWIKGVGATLLDQYTLTSKNWDLASDAWIATRNITPNVNCPNSSPHTEITGNPTDIARHFRLPFGCPVTVNDSRQRNHKFDLKNRFGIIVGMSQSGNGDAIVLIPSTHSLSPLEVQDARPLGLRHRIPTTEETARFMENFERASDSIRFESPIEQEISDPLLDPIPGSTLGFNSLFSITDTRPIVMQPRRRSRRHHPHHCEDAASSK